MRLLRTLAGESRGLLVSALVLSAVGGLTGAWLVALINRALAATAVELPRIGGLFAAVSAVMLVARWLSQAQFARLGQATMARLRMHVAASLASSPVRVIEAQGPARQMAVVVEDIGTVTEFFVMLPRVVMQGGVVIGCLAYLAVLSLPAFALALAILLAASRLHYFAVRRASEHLARARAAEDGLYGHFRALFAGAKELRLHAGRSEAFAEQVLAPSIETVRGHRTRGLAGYVMAGSVGAFMFFVVIGCVIFGLSAWMDVAREVRAGYALMFLYMIHPMESLLEAIPELARTRVALAKIDALCAHAEPADGAALAADALAHVRLDRVTHSYRRDTEEGVFVLGPISLELRAGEVLLVVGGNGSGKTTLAKLLLGLYAPESGSVLRNGVPVDPRHSDAYRQDFAAVFADFHLFERTYGLAPGLEPRARALLEALDLDHKVTLRDGAFSTTELSRGQQKRLALLVACLEDRPAYVFDEWAADQDPAYKDVFYTQILPELRARGKAVLVISHDDRYFDVADRRLKLEAGRLVPVDDAVVGAAVRHAFSLPARALS